MKAALTDVISERLKNAFLANFILSWLVVNHSIVFYLFFSDDKPNDKLNYINELQFSWSTDVLLPLVLVFSYVYILPLINLSLMKVKLKLIEPLLASHKNDEQELDYKTRMAMENQRLDLLFREKEREIELEENRTKEQMLRTKAAEEEARFYSDKQISETKALELEKAKREELEKVVKLEHVVERERDLDQREALIDRQKELLSQDKFKYELKSHQARWFEVNKQLTKGDRATIDFVGSIDGEEFEGGKAENFPIVLGEGRMIPGFEDGLLGRQQGDDTLISLTFPKDYHAENLKGKSAQFAVKINKVESQMIPLTSL